jgi:nucleotide-binding universal stress UspA family protein
VSGDHVTHYRRIQQDHASVSFGGAKRLHSAYSDTATLGFDCKSSVWAEVSYIHMDRHDQMEANLQRVNLPAAAGNNEWKCAVKFKHILFPIDFADDSRSLNSEVQWLAERFNSKVTLLHVYEIPASWYATKEAAFLSGLDLVAFAQDEQRRLREYSIQIAESRLKRIWLQGDAASEIVNWYRNHPTDIIVMGTRGLGALRGMLLGSVAMKVLHEADCPVWTHGAHQGDAMQFTGIASIVCPLELTTETVPLLRFAKDVATQLAAHVRLLHALPAQELRAGHKFVKSELWEELREMAAFEIAKKQRLAGTEFDLSITPGYVAQDAAELAVDLGADLMIIGRGHARRAFGSLRTHTFDIIRDARCPVLSYATDWHGTDVMHNSFSEVSPLFSHV